VGRQGRRFTFAFCTGKDSFAPTVILFSQKRFNRYLLKVKEILEKIVAIDTIQLQSFR
jgi:hypothetical protein